MLHIIRQISFQKIVGGNHGVILINLFEFLLPFRLRAGHQQYSERRRKNGKFMSPVINQGSRTNYQGNRRLRHARGCTAGTLFLFRCQQGYRLKRFSQAHVVCKDPAEPVAVQHLHPDKTGLLIFAQNLPLFCRRFIPDRLR